MNPLPSVVLLTALAVAAASTSPLDAAPTSQAAQPQGVVQGTVVSADDGAVIPGALAELVRGGEARHSATTDDTGGFRFEDVAAGAWDLRVRGPGFRERVEEIEVPAEGTLQRTVPLEPDVFGVDTLQVLGHGIGVRRDVTEFGPRIDASAIRDLPLPYDPAQMTAFVPGATEDRVWGAADHRANLYQVEGLAQTHPGTGGPLMTLSPAWIEAVEVRGLGAGADQGNFQGAVVNMVTRSGGATFESRVRTSFETHSLNATNTSRGEVAREIAGRAEVEAEAGGPIVPGRFHYFAAAHLVQEDVRARSRLPAFEDEPFLPFQEERREARAFGKLTWMPGPRDRVELGGAHTEERVDGWGQNGYLGEGALGNLERPASFANLSWRRDVGSETWFEARGALASARDRFTPAAGLDVPAVRLFTVEDPPAPVYRNSEFALDRKPATRSVMLRGEHRFATGFLGHRLQVGAQLDRSSWLDRRTRTGGMTWRPPRLDRVDPDDPSTWPFGSIIPTSWGGEVDLDARMGSEAAWIQDNLDVHDRLTLTPGVRWGRWRGDLVPGGRESERFRAVDDAAWEPRLGAIFEVPGTDDFLIKAHLGRYHQNLLAQFFDRAEGADVYSNRELWYLRNGPPSDPSTTFTPEERDALAAEGDFQLVEEVVLNQTGPVSPDYRQPYVDQWLVGTEKNFGDRVRVEAVWVERRNRDLVALRDRNMADNYTRFRDIRVLNTQGDPYSINGEDMVLPEVYVPNDWLREHLRLVATGEVPDLSVPPGMTLADTVGLSYDQDLWLENVSEARRHTRQLQLGAHVLGDGWATSVTFAWTRVEGNFDSVTGYRAGSGFERIWDLGPGPWVRPNERANFEGTLPGHTPLELKVLWHGDLPWGLRGGVFMQATRGEHFTPYFRVNALSYDFESADGELEGSTLDARLLYPMSGERIFMGPRGSNHYADRFTMDLRLEREIPVPGGRWSVTADLFNAWNSAASTEINAMVNYPSREISGSFARVDESAVYRAVWERLPPRTLRLGVTAAF